MALDSFLAQHQLRGDLGIAAAIGAQAQHLQRARSLSSLKRLSVARGAPCRSRIQRRDHSA
jgi:hypothetical protein